MKSINLTNNKIILFLYVILFTPICALAQNEPTFEDDVLDNPPPAAPIDFWIIPMIILSLLYVYYFLNQSNCRLKNE